MTRPAHIELSKAALEHNARVAQSHANHQQVIAMVKANAYGLGIGFVVPVLSAFVDGFGVASLEEAQVVRRYSDKPCVLLQGIYSNEELEEASADGAFELVVHEAHQLTWLKSATLEKPVRVWVKVDTGMHRLGFMPDEVPGVIEILKSCQAVQKQMVMMTHFASASEKGSLQTKQQLERFDALDKTHVLQSLSNSAALLTDIVKDEHLVRPGIMLYGVSPFFETDGVAIGLKPVMRLTSSITAVHALSVGEKVGYGGTWEAKRPSRVAVVAIGYGDGYPRHVKEDTPVHVNGCLVPIVGRISMDMLTIDITDFPDIQHGMRVELWGEHLPVERIARASNTIGYELITQISPRVRSRAVVIA